MTIIRASAPASLMITGEHAVVQGYPAIVAAIAPRLCVTLRPRGDNLVTINSALAHYRSDLATLADHPQLRFLLAALREQRPAHGVDITVDSAIAPDKGLGSSAAVLVATVAAFARWHGTSEALPDLHARALRILRAVQQRGSGADLAAALWGGMLAYSPRGEFRPLPLPPAQLSGRYAGYKTPTGAVLARVAAAWRGRETELAAHYAAMGACSKRAIVAAQNEQWGDFFAALNAYQPFFATLDLCDATQAAHLAALAGRVAAAKISGSGLGDCIIAFADHCPPAHEIFPLSTNGVQIDDTEN